MTGGPMVMDTFVVAIAVGVVGVEFSRVGVCSHGNRVRSGVKDGKQQIIVPHSPGGSDQLFALARAQFVIAGNVATWRSLCQQNDLTSNEIAALRSQ